MKYRFHICWIDWALVVIKKLVITGQKVILNQWEPKSNNETNIHLLKHACHGPMRIKGDCVSAQLTNQYGDDILIINSVNFVTLIEGLIHMSTFEWIKILCFKNSLKKISSLSNFNYEKKGRRVIEPNTGLNQFIKIALNVFCMH